MSVGVCKDSLTGHFTKQGMLGFRIVNFIDKWEMQLQLMLFMKLPEDLRRRTNINPIYKKAIALWGIDSQMMMAVEESSELMKAICKLRRNGVTAETVNNLAEEIADMEIMLEQLKVMFYLFEGVEEWKNYKLKRLSKMVKEAMNSVSCH